METLEGRSLLNATGVNDTGTVSEDAILTLVNGADASVVTNDLGTPPKQVVLFNAVSAQGATVNINTDGTFTYNPTTSATLQALGTGQTMNDTFGYVVQDAAETFTPNVVAYGTYTGLANGGGGGGGGLASLDARIAAGLPNFTGTVNFLDFNDPQNGGGHFGFDTQPNGLGGGDDNDFGVVSIGTLRVTASQFYTFGTYSDDNSRIRIDVNQNRRLATDGSENYGLQNGCCGDVNGTPVFLTAGQDYDFQVMFTEGGGGGYGEFYYAAGSFPGGYGSSPGSFTPLGNSAFGITIGTKSFSTATVTVTVQGANDAANAGADSYTTNENTMLNVPATLPTLSYGVWNTAGGTNGDLDNAIAASAIPTKGSGTITLVDFVDDVLPHGGTFAGGTLANGLNNSVDDNNYGIRVTGFIQVNTAGNYIFTRNTDDAARVRIDLNQNGTFEANEAIIDVNGNATNSSASTALALGQYAIQLQYVEGGGGSGGDFYYNRVGVGTNVLIGDASQGISVLSKPGVLGNDYDPEKHSLTVTGIQGGGLNGFSAQGAAVTMNADGSFSYNPAGVAALQALDAGQTLVDTFTYRVTESGGGLNSTGTVSITVTGVSEPENDSYSVGEDAILNVAAPGVLANDDNSTEVLSVQGNAMPGSPTTPGDGNVATTATGGGALTVGDTGGFTYTPPAAFNSLALGESQNVTFNYTVPGIASQVVTNDFGANPTLQGWTVLSGTVFFRAGDGDGLTPGPGFIGDGDHTTLIIQSPAFKLLGTVDGTNAISVEFAGGAGNQDNTAAPLNQAAVTAFNGNNSNGNGQKGLAFLNTATNNYDAVIFENNDGGTDTRNFTIAQLQALAISQGRTFDPNATYRLQYYENDEGGWGWGQLNIVRYSQLLSTNTSAATSAGTSQGTAFTVSSTDLINGVLGVVTLGALTGPEGTSNNPAILTNGLFGTAGIIDGGQNVAIQNNTTIQYSLNTGLNPQGYTLTSIATYAGWQDAGRDNQDYTVEVEKVGAPGVWTSIATVAYAGTVNSTQVIITPTVAGTTLASNVSKVRFAFGTQENGHVGYRELDVFGFATPPTSATATITVNGVNDAPNAPVPGVTTITEGGASTLTVPVAATDVDTTDIVRYQWDLDGNGATIEIGGATGLPSGAPITWAQLVAINPLLDGPGAFAGARVRSIDDSGAANNTSAWVPVTINVTNAPPDTVSITPTSDTSAPGVPIEFTLNATDPSDVDQNNLFEWDIDWDGDLVADETIQGLDGTTVTHPFLTLGTHTVTVLAVRDIQGDSDPLVTATVDVFIEPVVQDQITGDVLFGGDDTGADRITVVPVSEDGIEIVHSVNGGTPTRYRFYFEEPGWENARIIINGNGGADDIRAGTKITRVVEFYGGEGNDYLAGGLASDSLFGGNGLDRLLGSAGNDLLEGGNGNDSLDGGLDNDMLYGGEGTDTLVGNSGNDVLFGGNGIDKSLNGGNGDDIIFGEGPNDSLGSVPESAIDSVNTLTGGNGHDVLVGGEAADVLNGGYENDILIGGLGLDSLNGGQNEDVLVAGYTDYDAAYFQDDGMGGWTPDTNLQLLMDLQAEWGSGGGDYATRRTNLMGLGLDATTVHNDAVRNNLVGSTGTDWFLAKLTDKSDRVSGEKLNFTP